MRILYNRDDGAEYVFLRPGAPVGVDCVHQKQEVLAFGSRDEAASLLRRLAYSPATMAVMRALLPAYTDGTRLTEDSALRRLAECLWRRELVVHCRSYARQVYIRPAAAGAPAPAGSAAPPKMAQVEETDTFAGMHDGAAQAKALKEAAQAGVPFCEECQKQK